MEAEAADRGRQASALIARLGGTAKLDALVSAFYFNVLSDARVAGFFADVDIRALLDHQKRFLAFALGSERPYDGRSLRAAHRHLVDVHGLADSHFDAFLETLARTLTNLGHAADIAEDIVAVAETVRDDVLGRR